MGLFDPANDPNGRALKQRTQGVYDQEMQDLQAGPQDAFTVMNMQANQRNAMSPMAPWLQALQEAAGGRKVMMGGKAGAFDRGQQLAGTSQQPHGSVLALRHAARLPSTLFDPEVNKASTYTNSQQRQASRYPGAKQK